MALPKITSREQTVSKDPGGTTVTVTTHTEYEGGGFGGGSVRLPAPGATQGSTARGSR